MNNNADEIIRNHVVNMVENLKRRIKTEIPASGQFNMISAKVNQSTTESYVKELSLDVFQESNLSISLEAAILDIRGGRQVIPLVSGSVKDIVTYLNRDNILERLTDKFKVLLKYAGG